MGEEMLMALNNLSELLDKIDSSLNVQSTNNSKNLIELNQSIRSLQNSIVDTFNNNKSVVNEQKNLLIDLKKEFDKSTSKVNSTISTENIRIQSESIGLDVNNPILMMGGNQNLNLPVSLDYSKILDTDVLNNIKPIDVPVNLEFPEIPNIQSKLQTITEVISPNITTLNIPISFDSTNLELPKIDPIKLRFDSTDFKLSIESIKVPVEYKEFDPNKIIELPIKFIEPPLPKLDPMSVDLKYNELPKLNLDEVFANLPSFKIPIEYDKLNLPTLEPLKQKIEFEIPQFVLPKIEPIDIDTKFNLPKIEPIDVIVNLIKPNNFELPEIEPISVPIKFDNIPTIENIGVQQIPLSFGQIPNFIPPIINPIEIPVNYKVGNINDIIGMEGGDVIVNLNKSTLNFSEIIESVNVNLSKLGTKLTEVVVQPLGLNLNERPINLETTNNEIQINDTGISNTLERMNQYLDVLVNKSQGSTSLFTQQESNRTIDNFNNLQPTENQLKVNVDYEKLSSINSDLSNKMMMSIDPTQFKSLMNSLERESPINVQKTNPTDNTSGVVDTKTISFISQKEQMSQGTSDSGDMIGLLGSLNQQMSVMVNTLASIKTWFDGNHNTNISEIRQYKHF